MVNQHNPHRDEKIQDICQRIKSCKKCQLCKERIQAVPGFGNWDADIMLVGEGPGKHEDLEGIPFVGSAGKLLTQLLDSIEVKREDIFITNMVKCRPPHNRDPKPEELDACLPYLREQTALIRPKVICALGRFAMKSLIDPHLSISEVHGKCYRKKGQLFIALYHPAAALYNGSLKKVLQEDFLTIKKYLENRQEISEG